MLNNKFIYIFHHLFKILFYQLDYFLLLMRADECPITQTRLFQSGGRNDVYNFIKERSISRSPS